ncbi:bola-like protein, partial [Gorgonomyces haynaldii]
MPVSSKALEQVIREKLEPTILEITDTSDGCGQSFEVVIVSEKFQGLKTLQRHRLVNDALKKEIGDIHAFSQ